MEEDSGNSRVEENNSLKDDPGNVEVDIADSGEAVELPPDSLDLIQAVKEGLGVENSASSDHVKEAEEGDEDEPKVEEAVVASDVLPVSDTNINIEEAAAAAAAVTGSVEQEPDAADPFPEPEPEPEVSEIPRSSEDQPSTPLTHQITTSWRNCCGLLDLIKGKNQ